MNKFAFRLQKVLTVNEIQEENAQKRFASAEQARSLQKDKLSAAETAVTNQRISFKSALTSGINAGDALINHRFGIKLQRQAGDEAKKLKHASEISSDRRKELMEAARRRKMPEILKDKEFEKYRYENLRAESNELDETACRRFTATPILAETDV